MRLNPQFAANLVTFTEKLLNEKLYILCSAILCFSKTENACKRKIIGLKVKRKKILETKYFASFRKYSLLSLQIYSKHL